MATIKKIEDIEAWQLARTLNREIYPLLLDLQEKKNYELYRQMERSAGSIMDNIAEGFERDGTREFMQFLSISKGSTGELRAQLYRALDRNLVSQNEFDKYQADCVTISNKLGKFISYLNGIVHKGKKYNK